MEKNQLTELIDKYLAGKCNPEEVLIIEKWYGTLSETQKEFYCGNVTEVQNSRYRSESALRAKLGLMHEQPQPYTGKKLTWFKWAAAASIIFITSVIAVLYFNSTSRLTYTIVSTKAGEIKHILLPDGSAVWLNAGSTLRFANNYDEKNREVYLSGEGYFDVKHNVVKPFNVYAGNIKTHVLGTSFSVSSYAGALNSTVAVTRGKVQVGANNHVVGYLLPDQELEYASQSGVSKIVHVKSKDVTAWMLGKLAFVDMPMQDIAIHLQSWYGVKRDFKNKAVLSKRYTASFNNNIRIDDLLIVMNEVTNGHYKFNQHNKTITDY